MCGGPSGVDSDSEDVVPLNGICFNKLIQIEPGQSVQYCIIELSSRKNSSDAFAEILSNPKKLIEGRFEQL